MIVWPAIVTQNSRNQLPAIQAAGMISGTNHGS
jgi:hypothetical protein